MVKIPLYKRHGTYNCYLGPLKCRCDECLKAMSHYWDNYKKRKGITEAPLVEINCRWCGTSFMGKPTRKYCCRQCGAAWQSARATSRPCRKCGQPFPAHQDSGRIKYSLCAPCQELVTQDPDTCGLCGVRWWQGDGNRFCSDECRNLDAMRQAIIAEDYL